MGARQQGRTWERRSRRRRWRRGRRQKGRLRRRPAKMTLPPRKINTWVETTTGTRRMKKKIRAPILLSQILPPTPTAVRWNRMRRRKVTGLGAKEGGRTREGESERHRGNVRGRPPLRQANWCGLWIRILKKLVMNWRRWLLNKGHLRHRWRRTRGLKSYWSRLSRNVRGWRLRPWRVSQAMSPKMRRVRCLTTIH